MTSDFDPTAATKVIVLEDDGPCVTPMPDDAPPRTEYITNKCPEIRDTGNLRLRGRGRPRLHGLTNSPTYYSYQEARKRCRNQKHPQYKDYGGRGIECRFRSVQELVEDIGLRPEGHTLDRKDGSGHYEPGNVQWATPKEQANNRRLPFESPSRYQARSFTRRRDAEKLSREQMRHATRAWSLSIALFNGVRLSTVDWNFLQLYRKEWGAPRASFRLDHLYDSAFGHCEFISLPGLTSVDQPVVLQAGPFADIGRRHPRNQGYLIGMTNAHPSLNCSEEERGVFRHFLKGLDRGGKPGLCIVGPSLMAGEIPIEGRLLALASFLAQQHDVSFAACGALAEALWDSQDSQFDGRFLVVPNLTAKGLPVWRLRKMLTTRARERVPTIFFIESLHSVGEHIADVIDEHYLVVTLGELKGMAQHVFRDGPIRVMPEKPYV